MLPRRLDKFVREATRMSLLEAREAIHNGEVSIRRPAHSTDARDPAELVFGEDVIQWKGKPLVRRTQHTTYVLNKPPGVTTTVRDPRGKRDLSEWLAQLEDGTFPVGRLDRATTGALLFTTDGDLATAILRPDHETRKIYWLWLNECIPDDDPRLRRFLSGVPMLGAVGRAEAAEVLTCTEDMTELLLTLSEGKNRQIRRMCHALDIRLLHLHRRSIENVTVEGLALGELRRLDEDEVEVLWRAVGGRAAIETKQLDALRRQASKLRAEGSPHDRLEIYLASKPQGARLS